MKAGSLARPVEILLVEDNLGDQLIARKLLSTLSIPVRVHAVETVDEALARLRPKASHDSSGRPDLILLDLNLPGRDGRELLRECGTDRRLRSIPVVVLSGSAASHDVRQAYAMCANGYLCKGAAPAELRKGLNALATFFLGEAELPSRASPHAETEAS